MACAPSPDVELAVAWSPCPGGCGTHPSCRRYGSTRDLEDMRQHVRLSVGLGMHRLRARRPRRSGSPAGSTSVGLGSSLTMTSSSSADAGAGARRDEADRDQMALAQGLLQRRVQFRRIDVAVVEVALDERRRRPRPLVQPARGALRPPRRSRYGPLGCRSNPPRVRRRRRAGSAAGTPCRTSRWMLLQQPGRLISWASILLTTITRSRWREAA